MTVAGIVKGLTVELTDINGRELKYPVRVTEDGYVIRNGRVLNTYMRGKYKTVNMIFKDGNFSVGIHQLVFYAYNGVLTTRDNGMVIHHIDGDKLNNNLWNLDVITRGLNSQIYSHMEAQRKEVPVYNEANIEEGIVPMFCKGKQVYGYAISINGEVMKFDKEADVWRVLPYMNANKNVSSNVVVNVNSHGVSLGQLMAENFMVTEPERKYRVHQLDKGNGFENDFNIFNLRIAYVGN